MRMICAKSKKHVQNNEIQILLTTRSNGHPLHLPSRWSSRSSQESRADKATEHVVNAACQLHVVFGQLHGRYCLFQSAFHLDHSGHNSQNCITQSKKGPNCTSLILGYIWLLNRLATPRRMSCCFQAPIPDPFESCLGSRPELCSFDLYLLLKVLRCSKCKACCLIAVPRVATVYHVHNYDYVYTNFFCLALHVSVLAAPTSNITSKQSISHSL